MSRDRCKNRLWKKQLEHCNVFCLIKMKEKPRFSIYTLQKSVRKEFHGREGKWDPSISMSFKLTVQTGSHCWGWSRAQVLPSSAPEQGLSLAVSTSSKVGSGERTPHAWGSTPHSLALGLVSTSPTELWAAQSQKPPGKWEEKGTISRRNRWSSLSTSVFYWGSCYCE